MSVRKTIFIGKASANQVFTEKGLSVLEGVLTSHCLQFKLFSTAQFQFNRIFPAEGQIGHVATGPCTDSEQGALPGDLQATRLADVCRISAGRYRCLPGGFRRTADLRRTFGRNNIVGRWLCGSRLSGCLHQCLTLP